MAVERGRYLATVRLGCVECHGADFAGKLIVDGQPVWTWYAPNITRGGVTAAYSAEDWDRLIRHGVKPDGTNATMPAVDYAALSDQEVSDVIAFAQSLPASDAVQPPTQLGPVGVGLLAFGVMPIAAEEIDHQRPHLPTPPPKAINATFGGHVAQTCVGCHRGDFSGGPIAAGPPDWPLASNLTPGGDMASWSEADFLRAMQQGVRPDGRQLSPVMPWSTFAGMDQQELKAMWVYFQGLEAKPTGN